MINQETVTLTEACKLLGKSKKTICRYIKQGLLKVERIKSQKGTLEYRFNRTDLLNFKKTERKEKTKPESDIVSFLKGEIKVKNEQIKNKDEQIKAINERYRETNVMYNNLQNKLLLTDSNMIYETKDKKDTLKEEKGNREDKKGQRLNGWLKRLFKQGN